MPIRPEDFDVSPPPRDATSEASGLRHRAPGKGDGAKKRWRLWFSIRKVYARDRRTITLSVGAGLFALAVLISAKPLTKAIGGLLSGPLISEVRVPDGSRPDYDQERAELEREKKRLADQQAAFEAQAAERANEQAKQDELNRKQLADAKTALETQRRKQAKEAALARQEEADRQKLLTDQQAAFEKQKQEEAEAAARAREQAKQEELIRLQKQQELEAKDRERVSRSQYHGPSSGALVWEGDVDGADLIDIQGGSPNHGVLHGAFPGLPVMVQAFPADSVTISVAPGPSNDWKRIVLQVRTNGSKKKKVTVRWALLK
jgi:hypothetical protein